MLEQRALEGMEPPVEPEHLAALEALLFAAAQPLSLGAIGRALNTDPHRAAQALAALARELERPERGLKLAEVAGGYRLVTQERLLPYLARLEIPRTPPPLTPAQLETLALVAYRQPVTRAEIEAVRGVRCEAALRVLMERGLVQEVGRKPVPGRPVLYGTGPAFLEYVGLRSLEDLPPVQADRNPGDQHRAG